MPAVPCSLREPWGHELPCCNSYWARQYSLLQKYMGYSACSPYTVGMLFDCVEHYLLCARQSRHLNNMHEIPFIPEGVGGLWHFKETLYTDCSGSDGRRHISDKYCTLHACARSLCNKQEKAITLPKSEFIVFAPAYTCKCFWDGKKKKKKHSQSS